MSNKLIFYIHWTFIDNRSRAKGKINLLIISSDLVAKCFCCFFHAHRLVFFWYFHCVSPNITADGKFRKPFSETFHSPLSSQRFFFLLISFVILVLIPKLFLFGSLRWLFSLLFVWCLKDTDYFLAVMSKQ